MPQQKAAKSVRKVIIECHSRRRPEVIRKVIIECHSRRQPEMIRKVIIECHSRRRPEVIRKEVALTFFEITQKGLHSGWCPL